MSETTEPTTTLLSQKAMKKLVASGETESAINALGHYFEQYDWPKLESQWILLSNKWETYESHQRTGTLSNEKLLETKAQINKSTLEITDAIFEELRAAQLLQETRENPPKPIGIREDKLKREVAFWVFTSKIIVFIWLLFLLDTGMGSKRFWAIFNLTLPTFSVYMGLIIQDMVRYRYVTPKKQTYRFLHARFRYITHLVFPIYTIALLVIIANQVKGNYGAGLDSMNQWIGFVEMLMAGYLGTVVIGVFKEK